MNQKEVTMFCKYRRKHGIVVLLVLRAASGWFEEHVMTKYSMTKIQMKRGTCTEK